MTEPSWRSPYWALVPPIAALLASGARWLVQGSGNVYTAASRRYYLPDPDLGWRIVLDGPPWLGLDVIAAVAVFTASLAGVAWFVRQRERDQSGPWRPARLGLWGLGVLPLVAPIWAFGGGMLPPDARAALPAGVVGPPPGGIEGSLAGVPAGRYEVVPGAESAIMARVAAGGETFDTRFAGNLAGHVELDPADLEAPVRARVRVDAASVDTGVRMRTEHAASPDFLDVESHPEIAFELGGLTSARQGAGPAEIRFWADGVVTLMGKEIPVPVQGTARAVDQAGRQRLGLSGPGLVISADFTLLLEQTPLSGDSFDEDRVPVQAALILTHASNERASGVDKAD